MIPGFEISLVGELEVVKRSRVRPWESFLSGDEVNANETCGQEANIWSV